MRILITGVAGFIGSNLAEELLKTGYIVCGIDNLSYGSLENMVTFRNNPNFTFLKRDLLDSECFSGIEPDIIIHLASQKIPRYASGLNTLTENYEALKMVAAFAVQTNARLIFASTADVYGKNNQVPFTEESDLVLGNTNIKRWAYALSKIYGEQYLYALNMDHGLKFTILRFFGSYGPNHHQSWWGGPQSVFIDAAIKNQAMEIHGDGLQTRTFTYIKDTVAAIVCCIENEKATNEVFNVAGNPSEEISILDLGGLIWKLVNSEQSQPKIQLTPYSNFGLYEDVTRRVPDCNKIERLLGFLPKWSLTAGLQETILWHKSIATK